MQILVLIIINKLLFLSLIVWFFAIFGTFFMFDAPGSESNWLAIGLALSVWLYPIPLLVGDFYIKKYIEGDTKKSHIAKMYIMFLSPLSILFFTYSLGWYSSG